MLKWLVRATLPRNYLPRIGGPRYLCGSLTFVLTNYPALGPFVKGLLHNGKAEVWRKMGNIWLTTKF